MRKLLSIPLAVLILFSGLTVNIATHYCGGSPVATRVSLTGELASCGMEQGKPEKSPQGSITNHCCDNVISSYSFNNKFVPSYSSLSYPVPHLSDGATLTFGTSGLKDNFKLISEEVIRPPGINIQSQYRQEFLCIFRI